MDIIAEEKKCLACEHELPATYFDHKEVDLCYLCDTPNAIEEHTQKQS